MIKIKSHFYSNKTNYTNLLCNLILLFLLIPLGALSSILDTIIRVWFLLIIILSIQTLALPNLLLLLFRLMAIFAFGCNLIFFPDNPFLTELTLLVSQIFYVIFFSIAIVAIAKRISDSEIVDNSVISGSICIYLLLGIIWFFFYQIIYLFDSNAFSHPEEIKGRLSLFYFSFTTLTTVGYGDISPINPFGMTFANLEAIIGQLYPAIIIARLVGLYNPNKKMG